MNDTDQPLPDQKMKASEILMVDADAAGAAFCTRCSGWLRRPRTVRDRYLNRMLNAHPVRGMLETERGKTVPLNGWVGHALIFILSCTTKRR